LDLDDFREGAFFGKGQGGFPQRGEDETRQPADEREIEATYRRSPDPLAKSLAKR
jgi:hypothetical protein